MPEEGVLWQEMAMQWLKKNFANHWGMAEGRRREISMGLKKWSS